MELWIGLPALKHPLANDPTEQRRGLTIFRARAFTYPYIDARVSTDGQSVEAQVRQLRAAGARKVFREVASEAKTDRAQLRRVISQLDVSDALIVTRLDRLDRSSRDLLNTLAAITDRKAGFRSRQ
jgi:DNA invertase Pin-like site-specific DNA recombinase